MMATLLRKIVRGFNVKRRVKTVVTNEACLPRPNKLSVYVIVKIYSIYAIIWVLLYTNIYTQRTRRIICAFFYTKREKRRVLYLYNETLRRRLGYARYTRIINGIARYLTRSMNRNDRIMMNHDHVTVSNLWNDWTLKWFMDDLFTRYRSWSHLWRQVHAS